MDTYPPIFYMNDVSKRVIGLVHTMNGEGRGAGWGPIHLPTVPWAANRRGSTPSSAPPSVRPRGEQGGERDGSSSSTPTDAVR